MFFDFLFVFIEDFQFGGINYQVCDFILGGCFEIDIN